MESEPPTGNRRANDIGVRTSPGGHGGCNVLTAPELALRIGLREHLVRRAAAAGVIPSVKAGKLYLFNPADLAAIKERLMTAGVLKPATATAASA